ncbi:DUF6695 family protein [Aurantibacter sp.]|uniref:DUF6695 family protein n=1 Tax=Aurantibacter sp. TaxID=2807103 RepID=UPI0035C7EA63
MSKNTAFIIPLAYPDTVVRVSNEWYLQHLHYIGIGKKNYVKAGHAAFVLIEKLTGVIEYFDFGRYITPEPFGRVRSSLTDNELVIDLKAEIKNDTILNLKDILLFFATNPKLTHGKGRMVATVCSEVNYMRAKQYVARFQYDLIPYAAFKRKASNCARFVTDMLLVSVQNKIFIRKLNKIKLFTPSPIGNVLSVKGNTDVFEISDDGDVSIFKNKKYKEILNCFLDSVKDHKVNLQGNLEPKKVKGLSNNAQWLSGIGAGAWFELFKTEIKNEFIFKRTSAFGTVDVEAIFKVSDLSFNINEAYQFTHKSNCDILLIRQNSVLFKFENCSNLIHKERLV